MKLQLLEKEIRSIPGNYPVLKKLYKILDKGDAIGLIGAGASAGLWPIWYELLQNLIKYCMQYAKINKNEARFFREEAFKTPLVTAQQLRDKLGDNLYFEFLRETFKDKPHSNTGGAFTPIHKALMQLPIKNFLTLN
jgi:hypothetical protein